LGTKKELIGNQGRMPWAPRNPNIKSWKFALGTKEKVKSNPYIPKVLLKNYYWSSLPSYTVNNTHMHMEPINIQIIPSSVDMEWYRHVKAEPFHFDLSILWDYLV